MPKYLIEIPHKPDKKFCEKAKRIFLDSGSPIISKADWGCSDNEHRAWLVVEAENKDRAHELLPREYRDQANIVHLSKFLANNEGIFEMHHGEHS